MRYHDIHCRLTDKEYDRLRDMVNGGAISSFIRRQIFLGTDWSRILEIKVEIQKIRTELVRGNRVGSLETALKENNEILNELDRKLDQLIYLQKKAQAEFLEGSEDALQGSEVQMQESTKMVQGSEAMVPLLRSEDKNKEGVKQWQ